MTDITKADVTTAMMEQRQRDFAKVLTFVGNLLEQIEGFFWPCDDNQSALVKALELAGLATQIPKLNNEQAKQIADLLAFIAFEVIDRHDPFTADVTRRLRTIMRTLPNME
jgi:hypothetical protein